MTKQLENRISSREVAEMMDVRHSELLRKIEGINKDLAESKIAFSKYWIESSYKDASGKSNREFQVPKLGCEFLAHKTTGTKGNLFTDKYMDRFEKMKNVIQSSPSKKIQDNSIKAKETEARLNNSKVRKANILLKLADKAELTKEYKQVIYSYATAIIADKPLIPLPEAERKTYSATQIGQILGITSNKVGKLANANSLKTKQYGKLFHDKSRYSNKEVESFRYYEDVIPILKAILEG